ncbi:hypothetical protein KQH61_05955 [bacterium]|nr:hypothetical protein [bacterium]
MARVKVYPGVKSPTHQISLTDGIVTYALRLADPPSSLQDSPVTPSTVHFTGGGTKFGDWEPGMSHIEQRTWEGGRGQADFVDDATRFFDSKMAWTLTPGKVFPVPGWKFSKIDDFYTEGYQRLPGDMDWRSLFGSYRQIAEPVSHSSAWATYDSVWLWVRRVGTPADALDVELWVSNTGYPDPLQIKGTGTIAIADVPENESVLVKVDLSGGSALVGTASFIVIGGQLNDNAANHWEIGINADGATSYYNDGSTWHNDAAFSIYYRLLSAGTDRKWHLFEFEGALYAVDEKANGAASQLFINGDRGKVNDYITVTSFGDTTKSWPASKWVDAYVKITKGKGAGQVRKITGSSSSAIGIGPARWDIVPDTTSEYVIFHTPYWQDISPSTGDLIDGVVKSLCVVDDYVAFAQGQSVAILKMRWNPGASPPAHEFDDDSANKADILYTVTSPEHGTVVYAVNADEAELNQAAPTPWGTAMGFASSFDVGDTSLPILNLYEHDGTLYAFKPDGRYRIEFDKTVEDSGKATAGAASSLTDGDKSWTINAYKGRWVKITGGTGRGQMRKIVSNTSTILAVNAAWATNPDSTSEYQIFLLDPQVSRTLGEIGFIHSTNNGEAALSYGLYSYFSWGGYALQRLYDAGGNFDLSSIGPDKDEGLPQDRRGRVVDLLGTPPGIMAAIQGDGYSCVMVLPNNAYGWHEVFRGWASGAEIDHIFFQDSWRPRLWISVGGELIYQDWPRHSFNPLKDPEITYHHEAILISSTIDMGVSNLPKFIESLTATVENLGSGIEIALDYQTNEYVGTDTWIFAGSFQVTPWDALEINQGEVRQIRFRLRLRTNDESTPPILLATVMEGFARTPVKYQWRMRVIVSDTQRDISGVGKDFAPDDLLNWLKECAAGSKKILMRSIWEQLDSRYVIIEPPDLVRNYTNNVLGYWGGTLNITIREK